MFPNFLKRKPSAVKASWLRRVIPKPNLRDWKRLNDPAERRGNLALQGWYKQINVLRSLRVQARVERKNNLPLVRRLTEFRVRSLLSAGGDPVSGIGQRFVECGIDKLDGFSSVQEVARAQKIARARHEETGYDVLADRAPESLYWLVKRQCTLEAIRKLRKRGELNGEKGLYEEYFAFELAEGYPFD